MAKPINHDVSSTVTTAAWGGVKGAAKGLGLLLAVPAVLAGGIALLAGVGWAAAAMWAVGTAVAVGVGAAFSAPFLGTAAAVFGGGGALMGLAKGGDKISRENASFRDRMEHRLNRREAELNAAGQQGYQMGVIDAQNAIANQLRAAQEQMLMASAQPQLAAGGHTARIQQQREAAALAVPQR